MYLSRNFSIGEGIKNKPQDDIFIKIRLALDTLEKEGFKCHSYFYIKRLDENLFRLSLFKYAIIYSYEKNDLILHSFYML